jgi:beta-mannanase/cell division protein FtsB
MAERAVQNADSIYLAEQAAEQRRYKRLEVSLPVWLAEEADFNSPGDTMWSLGYTRDISLGGAKVIVPNSEETKWRDASKRDCVCLVRFDVPGASAVEYIQGRVKHAAHEKDSGRLWLGVEYDEGNQHEKSAAMRAGVKTVHTRRRWQGMLILALTLIGLSAIFIKQLNGVNTQQKQLIASKERARRAQVKLVSLLAGVQGAKRSEVSKLIVDIQHANDPVNREEAESERNTLMRAARIDPAATASTQAKVAMGVAVPFGYAWPQVINNLEQVIGRGVPNIVTFRDWKQEFPFADCRLARVSAKTMQITWEPGYWNAPKQRLLPEIIAGRHDAYIDKWAQGAKAFGSEVWIRWGHEFNGNWYSWSVPQNNRSAETYIKAYRHVHDRFVRAGAFNVRWVWCLNAENVPNAGWNDPLRAYPGDAYVDAVSIDGYNFGMGGSNGWQSFRQVFEPAYDRVARIKNKPLMIGEIGCATVGGDKAAWIRDMDAQLRGPFNRFGTVVWFEAKKEADWRMVSSPAVIKATQGVWRKPYYRRGET